MKIADCRFQIADWNFTPLGVEDAFQSAICNFQSAICVFAKTQSGFKTPA
jgi:hypothetical protein